MRFDSFHSVEQSTFSRSLTIAYTPNKTIVATVLPDAEALVAEDRQGWISRIFKNVLS